MTKTELRKAMRAAVPSAEVRAHESRELCRILEDWPVFQQAECMAAFMPTASEADILPLLKRYLEGGHMLALPRCGEKGQMTFHLVRSLDTLHPSHYGLLEPSPEDPVIDPKDFDLMLVPLVACDRSFHRLGHGGGYYDRCLPAVNSMTCGIALRFQLVESVPTDTLDIPLKALVTPDELTVNPNHHLPTER